MSVLPAPHGPDRRGHEDPEELPAPAGRRVALGVRGRDYAWSLRAIGDGLMRRAVPSAYRLGTLAPVLILPGVLEDWTMMRAIADRLNQAGHPIHVVHALRRNTVSLHDGAAIAADYLVDAELRDAIVVAHSKGGLIGKMLLLGEAGERVRRVIAIATPFGGSQLANWVPSRTIRALRPSDPRIAGLSAELAVNARIVSIAPSFDPHIPEGSFLPGAINVPVAVSGHFRVLGAAEVIDAVLSAAGDPPGR